MIVGRKCAKGNFPGDVPEFKIHLSEVDKVYLLIKKMQRCYHKREDPAAKYYSINFKAVEEAYLSQNIDEFKKVIYDLMVSIDCDWFYDCRYRLQI